MQRNRSTCLLLALFTSIAAFGQRYHDHKWTKARPNIVVEGGEFASEDAVLVYQYQTIQNNLADLTLGKLQVRTTVMRRIKMLTKKGVDQYSIIRVNKRPSDRLEVLDARTIKEDGKVIDVSAKDIVKLDLEADRFGDDRYEELRFAVPAAEPGDEIEMVFTLQSSSIRVGDDLYFHDELPIIHSVVVLDMENIFRTEVRPFNGLQEPTIAKSETRTSYRWDMKNLPGLANEDYSILAQKFPYVSFAVREIVITNQFGSTSYPVAPNSLANMFDRYVRAYSLEGLTDQSGYRLAEEIRTTLPDAGKVERAQIAVKMLADRLQITELPREEVQQPLRHHINKGMIDTWNLERLWWQTLTALDLEPWIAFGRNRYDGPLDASYVSPHLITATFFGFADEQGRMHFIFPSSPTSSYGLDELPWNLEGSNVLLTRKKNFQDLVADVKQFGVGRRTAEASKTIEVVGAQIDLSTGSMVGRHRMMFHGSMARKQQGRLPAHINDGTLNKALFGSAGISLDSVQFDALGQGADRIAKLQFSSLRTLQMEELEPGVRSVQLGDVLDAWTYGTIPSNRTTAIDLPYAMTDDHLARIQFSQPVELLNTADVTTSLKNAYGASSVSVTQVDPLTVEIHWTYTIQNAQIPAADAAKFNQLTELIEQGNKADMIIKVL